MLLQNKGIEFKESIIGIHIMRESFVEMFPEAKTVPHILKTESDGFFEVIGGYDQLVEYVKLMDNPDNGTEFLPG
jgi:hypothetical protein